MGKQQVWSARVALACQERRRGWRACLRIFGDGFTGAQQRQRRVQVWQSGEVRGGQVRFPPAAGRFCPLREASLCQMP